MSPGARERIVVDVGCKAHEAEESIEKLVGRFQPSILYGFDPHPMLEEGCEEVCHTLVLTRRAAAWTNDGTLPFTFDGTRSAFDANGAERVACFDLAGWLWTLPPCELVVKLDVEGAEYELLDWLHERGMHRRVSLFLVEWHEPAPPGERERLEAVLGCPVESW